MKKQSLTIEELEIALRIPSFEEELALSDLPHKTSLGTDKSAHITTCKHCGGMFIVGPGEPSKCPKGHDDPEDDVRPIPDSPYNHFLYPIPFNEDMDQMWQRR